MGYDHRQTALGSNSPGIRTTLQQRTGQYCAAQGVMLLRSVSAPSIALHTSADVKHDAIVPVLTRQACSAQCCCVFITVDLACNATAFCLLHPEYVPARHSRSLLQDHCQYLLCLQDKEHAEEPGLNTRPRRACASQTSTFLCTIQDL